MNTRIQAGVTAILMVLFLSTSSFPATPQWQPGQLVASPPRYGTYLSMRLGTNSAPLPLLPPTFEGPVYFVGSFDGINVFCFDDINFTNRSSQQNSEDNPLLPDGDYGEGEGGGFTNYPPPMDYDYGTNLFIMIGHVNSNEAWLAASNTHYGVFYQLESRNTLADFAATPWVLGQIVQDTAGTNQVRFSNVRKDNPSQQYFRAVGGSMVASITVDPDYNLAVEPTTQNGSPQTGKFHVNLSPSGSSGTVVYQVTGLASNGVDYTTLSGSVSVSSSGPAEVDIQSLFDTLPEFDESVTLTLVPHTGNDYLVDPQHATATLKIYDPRPTEMAVAIHDSGWTRLVGLSSTNWNYFVMPESVKEALRSDGTPYAVVSDLDIATGALLNTNGTPRYPILISFAAEAVRDDEIAPLTQYVAAGGFALFGSSSLTRYTNGIFRTNFALAAQMGLNCSPSSNNWLTNKYLAPVVTNHSLVSHIPYPWVTWRMPASADETSWGKCPDHRYDQRHETWSVTAAGAEVVAKGDDWAHPYIAFNAYSNGCFIYDAALQPLIAHGGIQPGMYAYVILRRAVEWAFESTSRPVVKLSPWPYQYDAAFMVRHDLENEMQAIADVAASAEYECHHGAKGDYYFCTGEIVGKSTFDSIVTGLRRAVSDDGATIGPHNGGRPNPVCSIADPEDYRYFHWGPDEALDLPGGYDYASNSLAISFAQIETWVTNQASEPRIWVAPYFNATREDSYHMEEQLGIKITGDQKLTPFPHWTLSTQTDGKRYALLSEPVSDWYVGPSIAQALGPWQGGSQGDGLHDTASMLAAVDFYYELGALINLYSHTVSSAQDPTGQLVRDYIDACTNVALHPRTWPANAKDVYFWWTNRSTVQVSGSFGTTNGGHPLVNIAIAGSQDTNTAVEILDPAAGSLSIFRVWTNGFETTGNNYRTTNNVLKVRVGTSVTNVQAEYASTPKPPAPPIPQDDTYAAMEGTTLTVPAPGLLANDYSTTNWAGRLLVTNVSNPQRGSLNISADGGFTYTPFTNGTDCFTYEVTDGTNIFGQPTVTVFAIKANALFSDDFTRCTAGLAPWQVQRGQWSLAGRILQGTNSANQYAYCYINTNWTSYSVEAMVQFPAGGFGGGLGGRLNAGTGAHYAAWMFPEGTGGTNVLKLIKFSTWDTWGTNGVDNHVPMAVANVAVGTGWHPLKLVFNGTNIDVYYHGTNVISTTDNEAQPYGTGGLTLDVWTGGTGCRMSVSNLLVNP